MICRHLRNFRLGYIQGIIHFHMNAYVYVPPEHDENAPEFEIGITNKPHDRTLSSISELQGSHRVLLKVVQL